MSGTEPLTDFEQKPAGEEPATEPTTVTTTLEAAEEQPEQQESQAAAEQAEAQEPSEPAEPAGSAASEEQQSEEPAQQQEEAPAEGAGEQEAPQPEEGEGEGKKEEEEEGEGKKEEEEEPVVVVTPEGSPHWLSSDDVQAKGVPEAEVENYKNFHFKQAHALHTWYETLKEHTFPTEFITLTTAEVDVLLAAAHPGGVDKPELSEEQQELLTELEKKIDQAIKDFGEEEGACVKINTRSPTDAVLERNDATFIAEIRDAVINEVEVETQSANAYAIWTEKPEERPGVFRRGVDAIRSSFKRPRATSAARRETAAKAKLEEEKKEEEGEKEEEEGEKEEVVEKKEEEEGEKEIEEQKEGEDEQDGEGDGEGEKAERRPGVIRRGVEAIRRSFRRTRTSSATSKEDKTKQEEEKKEGEEEKEKEEGEKEEEGQKEEVAEGEGEKKEGEEEKKEEGEQEDKEEAEKKPGILRRGMEAIRRPFRRSQPSSDATGEETTKLEEEKPEGEGEDKEEEKEKEEGEKEEEGQKEEVDEGEGEKKEGEEEKTEGEEEKKEEGEAEGEKRPGLVRRGLDAIRRSFRRSRTSTGEKPQLEEEPKEGEEEKDGGEEGDKAEAEQTPTEQAADGEPAQTVTVEATIEGGEQPEAETTGEVQEQKTEGEGQAEEEQKESGAQEEGGAKAEGEGEIQELGKEEGEEPKQKSVPRSHRKKSKPVGEAHASRKGKSETPENQLLRAFARVTSSKYRVSNGKEAIDLVLRSIRVKQDLAQLKAFGEVEDLTVRLLVRQWQPQIPQYPGMQFRGFVYKNELHALSQYDDTTYYPNVAQYKMTIQQKVQEFFNEHVRDALKDFENYIINFFVAPDKVYIFRLLPFYTSVGACLFTWREHTKIFMNGPFEFRIVETAKAAPECFSSLQPEWADMLNSVIQQKHHHGSNCVLL